jgi:hypothetical protein
MSEIRTIVGWLLVRIHIAGLERGATDVSVITSRFMVGQKIGKTSPLIKNLHTVEPARSDAIEGSRIVG